MEFEFFGERCAVAHCRKHDYLPFRCGGCSGHFCLEHRTPDAHLCASAAARAPVPLPCAACGGVIARVPPGLPAPAVAAARRAHAPRCARARARAGVCPVPGCRARLAVPVACGACGAAHCVAHRLPEAHGCAAAVAGTRRPARRASAAVAEPAAPAGFANSPLRPHGDARVAGAERVHFEAHFAGGEGLPPRKALFCFASRNRLVGRTVDEIAKAADLPAVDAGHRLQLRTDAGVCGFLDRVGDAIPHHAKVLVEYAPPPKLSFAQTEPSTPLVSAE